MKTFKKFYLKDHSNLIWTAYNDDELEEGDIIKSPYTLLEYTIHKTESFINGNGIDIKVTLKKKRGRPRINQYS